MLFRSEFADWVIRACPNTGLALAANFSFLRPAKISEIIGQYLLDNSSADKQSDNDFGSDKVLDLLNKIADLSGKKSMGN